MPTVGSLLLDVYDKEGQVHAAESVCTDYNAKAKAKAKAKGYHADHGKPCS